MRVNRSRESGAARKAPARAHFRSITARSSIPREGTTWERDRGTQRTEGDSVRFKCPGRLSWGRVGVAVGVVGIIVVYARFLFGAFSLFPKRVCLNNNNNFLKKKKKEKEKRKKREDAPSSP